MSPFFRRLLSPHLPVQHAMVLLRECGILKWNHLLRSIAPTCVARWVTEFDVEVETTALLKLDGDHVEVPPSLSITSPRHCVTLILSLPLSPSAALASRRRISSLPLLSLLRSLQLPPRALLLP